MLCSCSLLDFVLFNLKRNKLVTFRPACFSLKMSLRAEMLTKYAPILE